MTDDRTTDAGVEVTTKTPPIAFIFRLFKTKVTVDGDTHVASWGASYYPLDPGRHSIEIGFRYFFGRNMGRRQVEFDVVPGQVVHVVYNPPANIFSAGTILIE